jgi:hypothetical protein
MVATKMPGKRGRLPNDVTMQVEERLAKPKALDSGGVEKRSAKAAVGTRIVVGFIVLTRGEKMRWASTQTSSSSLAVFESVSKVR